MGQGCHWPAPPERRSRAAPRDVQSSRARRGTRAPARLPHMRQPLELSACAHDARSGRAGVPARAGRHQGRLRAARGGHPRHARCASYPSLLNPLTVAAGLGLCGRSGCGRPRRLLCAAGRRARGRSSLAREAALPVPRAVLEAASACRSALATGGHARGCHARLALLVRTLGSEAGHAVTAPVSGAQETTTTSTCHRGAPRARPRAATTLQRRGVAVSRLHGRLPASRLGSTASPDTSHIWQTPWQNARAAPAAPP
jgi:hypothetical protein